MLLDQGNTIDYDIVTGWWKDTGTPDDILHANKLVLDTMGTQNQFVLNEGATVHDKIIMGKNTTISKDSFVAVLSA